MPEMRSGVIAQKVGMTRIFTENGEHIPVTVLKLDNVQVMAHRTEEKNGYIALQLGAGSRKVSRVTKAERQNFAIAKVEPKRTVAEFRVSSDNLIEIGAEITAADANEQAEAAGPSQRHAKPEQCATEQGAGDVELSRRVNARGEIETKPPPHAEGCEHRNGKRQAPGFGGAKVAADERVLDRAHRAQTAIASSSPRHEPNSKSAYG